MAELEISATIVIYTCWGSSPRRVMGRKKLESWSLTSNLNCHLGLLGQGVFQYDFLEISRVMPAGNFTCYFWSKGSYFPAERNRTYSSQLKQHWKGFDFMASSKLDKISWRSSHEWLLFKLNYSADHLLRFPVSWCKKHVSHRETFQVGSFTNRKTLPVV